MTPKPTTVATISIAIEFWLSIQRYGRM